MNLQSGEVSQLTNDSNVSEIVWLGSSDSSLLYINSTNADIPGGVELWISDVSDFSNSYVSIFFLNWYMLIEIQPVQGSFSPIIIFWA